MAYAVEKYDVLSIENVDFGLAVWSFAYMILL